MSVDDILFEPLGSIPVTSAPVETGIVRYSGTVTAEVKTKTPRRVYTDLATEIINHAVADMPSLTDIRKQIAVPKGAMDLTAMVGRYHDGNEDVWISRPKHMQPAQHHFTGRFGYVRACKMPQQMGKIGILTWYWVMVDEGQLPAVDLGLMVYHPSNKWWRVFTNQSDATDYYNS